MKKVGLPRWLRSVIHILLCLPFFWLVARGVLNTLDPDPGKTLVHGLGLWALRFLLLTLAMTPLNRFTPIQWIALRRTIGLYTLTYALLHVSAYAFFYLGFDVSRLARELVKRPYIVVGSAALSVLVVMGITSTRRWQQRLGKRWKQLHRLVYAAVVLVVIHFAWQVKSGFGHAPWYALVFIVLMLLRIKKISWKR
ncbi:MAG TPA: protein-methionine-sulfoxide reductase heme-binding subunit MsrQ [Pseudomonadales bacterium]|nr:protein-methionine-sulfoxide reductase heme-binding subunit MsrQ [Pseudomonadales bacterium]